MLLFCKAPQKEVAMMQSTEKGSPPAGLQTGAGVQGVLSNEVIPAVRGEYYAYSSKFTPWRPLYVLMKCKANKNRRIGDLKDLGREANLLFRLGDPAHVEVCSVRIAHSFGLLGNSVDPENFDDTRIAPTGITAADFYRLRSQKDAAKLVEASRSVSPEPTLSIALKPGLVVAMTTHRGKHGLFLVKGIAPGSIQIDACHILL